MSRKRYPEEFIIKAAKQMNDRGHSITNVAKRLDYKNLVFDIRLQNL